MKYLALLLPLLLLMGKEQQGTGVAYYALQGFDSRQCSTALRVFKGVQRPILAVLWSSFGDSTDCLDKFLNLPGNKTLMIHSTNESCKRNGRRCTEYDQPIFEERAEDITAFIKKNAGKAAFMVSTGLEDDLSTSAYKKRVHILEEALPLDTFIVRNPNAKNYSSRGADVVELHGANRKYNKGSCAYSNDGFDINFSRERRAINNYLSLPGLLSELDRAKRNRCSSFIWWDTQGGQFNLDWGWNVPRSRNIYIYPKDVISVNKILRRYQ